MINRLTTDRWQGSGERILILAIQQGRYKLLELLLKITGQPLERTRCHFVSHPQYLY